MKSLSMSGSSLKDLNLLEQLRVLLEATAVFGPGIQVLEARAAGQTLRVELAALDRLACAFDRLSLTEEALKGATVEHLKQVAEKLSARLTYLLEPISPIEIDAAGATVQMRSNPPQKEADRTTYYELLVTHAGELSLQRYTRPNGQPRSPIAAEVTREVLVRLAKDFSAAASG